MEAIKIRGLKHNNLKNINLDIPKNKIVVFTGVSGSGKSSIVFDTIAAESQRQMNETYDDGCFNLPAFGNGNYYWKVYRRPEYFRTDVPFKDLTEDEQNFLLYGSKEKGGERLDKKVEGVYNQFKRLVLMKSAEEQTDNTLKKISRFVYECECPDCKGKRLNEAAL